MKFSRSLALFAGVAGTALMITGCDLANNQLKMDRSTNSEFQNFRDDLAPRIPTEEDLAWADDVNADSDIPSLQSYVAQPSDSLKPMPLVSISVNQSVPLRDALFELAEQAEYDIELDPRISGSVIFTARERPFDIVIKRISEIAGLRYKFEDDSLRVELDTPYHATYKIDYLSYIRSNKSSIRNDVSVVAGETANTGSSFEAVASSEADFWGELEANIGQIINVGPTSGNLRTSRDPRISAVSSTPAVEAVAAIGADGLPVVNVQTPQTTLNVSSLPTDDIYLDNSQGSGNAGSNVQEASYSTNRQAGVISIYATERQHKQIEGYLKELRRSVTAQVLIEAKILEVSLKDEFAAGIDWSKISLPGAEFQIGFTSGNTGAIGGVRPTLTPATDPRTNFRVGYVGNDISAVVDAVSRFGTVHALASPRLTVMNNQSAVLNVSNNRVYFEIDIEVSQTENNVQTSIDSDIRNVPEGVLINVQPSIDLDARTISMAVRPTITRIVEYINDPSVQFVTAANNIQGVQSLVPVVNIQEMDSVVRMNSGDPVVMGGLMQDRATATQQGIPVLSEIPLFGSAFKNTKDMIEKTELVVFLKATIIDGATGTIEKVDKELYRKYSEDRRPLDM
jgi:MSHA biogenesis protein MshL